MITISDARMAMEAGLRQVLDHVLNTHTRLTEYWILIHAKVEGATTMFSKVVILPYQPPKLIGTVCYHINNREGKQTRLWVLPLDFPVPGGLLETSPNRVIIESAKDMPIIH